MKRISIVSLFPILIVTSIGENQLPPLRSPSRTFLVILWYSYCISIRITYKTRNKQIENLGIRFVFTVRILVFHSYTSLRKDIFNPLDFLVFTDREHIGQFAHITFSADISDVFRNGILRIAARLDTILRSHETKLGLFRRRLERASPSGRAKEASLYLGGESE